MSETAMHRGKPVSAEQIGLEASQRFGVHWMNANEAVLLSSPDWCRKNEAQVMLAIYRTLLYAEKAFKAKGKTDK